MNKTLSALAVGLTAAFGLSMAVYAADPVVTAGKQVKLDYTLTVNNQVVETSVGKIPLVYMVGDGRIIPGLAKALDGMHVGEQKLISVEPKDAYGEVDPKAFKEFPKTTMPKNIEPKVGMVLQAQAPDGSSFPTMISEIKDKTVVLDFNHPLAGKKLQFDVKILSIEDAPAMPKPVATTTTPVKK